MELKLFEVYKEGEKQGTAYGYECTSNGTWGRFHCGITKKPVQAKEKTPEEQKMDDEMSKKLKEDPWAVYVGNTQTGEITKYNVDAEASATGGGYQATYSLREGFSKGHVLNLPDPLSPSAEVTVCLKKETEKKETGTTVDVHGKNLTASYTPAEGKFCAGLTTEEEPGIGTSTPLQ
jgi:hypothetical protein